jgi:hypothetical protein
MSAAAPEAVVAAAPAAEPEGSVDVGRQLMAFNWLVASYAHRDWLGPWADVLEPRARASLRLVRRASAVMLERHDLQQRYVRDLGRDTWLLAPYARLLRMAEVLGTAMLGGWVRQRLERQQVAQQLKVLGSERRDQALKWAQTLKALPFPDETKGWPLPLSGTAAVFRLGASALVLLPAEAASGAGERTAMRFPYGAVVPLPLRPVQLDEALALVHGVMAEPQAAA